MKTIAIDFDGVIANYRKFEGRSKFGDPIKGAVDSIRELKQKKWCIIIHTSRSETDDVAEYLYLHDIPFDYINYNPVNFKLGCNPGKPIADIYVDDRAIKFEGNWPQTLCNIENFSEWWDITEEELNETSESLSEDLSFEFAQIWEQEEMLNIRVNRKDLENLLLKTKKWNTLYLKGSKNPAHIDKSKRPKWVVYSDNIAGN